MRLVALILLVVGCLSTVPVSAQGSDPAIEALLAMPQVSALAGAEQAGRVAWVESERGARNLWVGGVDGGARALTAHRADDGRDLYDLVLSRDGTQAAWVEGGDGEFPDAPAPNAAVAAEPPPQRVMLAPTDVGAAPRIIGEGHSPAFSPDGRRIAFVKGGALWIAADGAKARRMATMPGTIASLSWSPDGARLLFSNRRGGYALVGLFSVAEGTLAFPDPGPANDVEPVFSPGGDRIAFIRYLSPPAGSADDRGSYWSIRSVELASGAARTLWQAPAGRGGRYAGTRSRNLFWSADDRLVFPWEASGWLHVHALPAKGGKPVALTRGEWEVEAFTLDGSGRTLAYAANADHIDRRSVWTLPLTGGRAVRRTPLDTLAAAPVFAGERLAVIASDARRPAHAASIAGDRLVPLADRSATYRPTAGFVAPVAASFRAADGIVSRGQFFAARGPRARGRRPTLVFLHGGPRRQMLLGFHPSRYYANAYALNQHLAGKGYNVLALNYRGGTGYGLAFRDADETGRGGASEYRDLLAAQGWLAARPDVDPKRIGLWGGSWGGYMTALGLARDSGRFAAGVDLHGVHNLVRTAPSELSPEAQDAARALMWQSSPVADLDRWRSPVLLVHGDDDRNVNFSQSVDLAAALAERGVPYETLVFANERHSFVRHDSWVRAYAATVDFLDRHLGDAK